MTLAKGFCRTGGAFMQSMIPVAARSGEPAVSGTASERRFSTTRDSNLATCSAWHYKRDHEARLATLSCRADSLLCGNGRIV
jgi:hypothetical protein